MEDFLELNQSESEVYNNGTATGEVSVINDNNDVVDQIDYSDIIEENHLLLVTHLQLDRHFLFSYLRSKGILDEEDVEIVTNTGTTRQQRVSRFLDMIKRKGKIGMLHFVNALQYENPACFEKLTGRKANSIHPPPIPTGQLGLPPGEYNHVINDIDYSYLAKQLAQTTQEMQCLSQVHQKVIDERNNLEKKLMQANNNLKVKEEEIALRQKMHDTLFKFQPTEGNHERCEQLNQQELKIIQKDHLVTVLQGKLLEFMEEKECMRKENLDLKIKNNEFSRENLQLQYRYNTEKRQSILLKERVRNQEDDMNYIDKFKMDMKQNISDMKSLREENIALKKELEEFRKYSEVLNQKFKMVVKAKGIISEKELSSNQLAQEQLAELSNTNSMLLLEKEHLSKTNKRLSGDVSISTQLLNSVQCQWNKAIEDCKRLEKDLKKLKHEKEVAERVTQFHLVKNTELNKKYGDVCKELDELNISLQQANEEILRYKSMSGMLREGSSKCNRMFSKDVDADKISVEAGQEISDYLDIEEGMYNCRKKRSNLQVLNSIKRSVLETDAEKIAICPQSMSFEQIRMLYPAYGNNYKSASLPSYFSNVFSTENEKYEPCDEENDYNENVDIPFRPRV